MWDRKIRATMLLTGVLSAAALAISAGRASADTYQHRCDRYGCWTVECDDEGDGCTRAWDQDVYDRHYYTTSDFYDRGDGYFDRTGGARRTWVCDADGDDCHWAWHNY